MASKTFYDHVFLFKHMHNFGITLPFKSVLQFASLPICSSGDQSKKILDQSKPNKSTSNVVRVDCWTLECGSTCKILMKIAKKVERFYAGALAVYTNFDLASLHCVKSVHVILAESGTSIEFRPLSF